ncbi:ABC transporter G family member 23-like [Oppia nitens]|uniref:ABC transporter G family member 23-like n=1 Tax=Oppia nitens TaxID=1686743 RepID=UPI0023DABBF5|nr:ABC transporter G family member 23-like [Oppia nitens]
MANIEIGLCGQQTEPRYAVHVRNVNFCYSKDTIVLERMNVKIEEGKIFGLLGSNGCGKTTLLRLILGRLQPHSGHISIFGVKPGSKYSDIPGPGVGYMPQELALYNEFTIEETLTYYGILNNMNINDIKQRIEMLAKLLSISNNKKRVSSLSGGQQRLVSMAITMIHKPKLLILDEPTVGVDSLIRLRIWTYLENISKNDNVTIIVTTHYIEEARKATHVGFVTNGYLLAQSPPQQLMDQYGVKSLEEVYLKLTITRRRSRRQSLNPLLFSEERDAIEVNEENQKFNKISQKNKYLSLSRMSVLLWRNYLQLKGNPLLIVSFYSLTAIIITLMALVFNQDFKDMSIAIYNGDSQSAMDSVVNGVNLLALEFSQNFSNGFEERIQSPQDVSDQSIADSTVKMTLDMSDPILSAYTNVRLLRSLVSFIKDYSLSINYNPMAYTLPFNMTTIYSTLKPSFKQFVAPGLLLAIQYGLNMVLTAFVFIIEKRGGCLERCFVNGVTAIEIILVQIIWFTAILIIQSVLSLVLSFFVFDFILYGNHLEALLLLILEGIHGLVFGMITSLLVSNDYNVMMIMVFATLPLWLISGMVWPLEALHSSMQKFCRLLPLSLPTEALRSIMFRGLNSFYPVVYMGYLSNLAYITVLLLICTFVLIKHR